MLATICMDWTQYAMPPYALKTITWTILSAKIVQQGPPIPQAPMHLDLIRYVKALSAPILPALRLTLVVTVVYSTICFLSTATTGTFWMMTISPHRQCVAPAKNVCYRPSKIWTLTAQLAGFKFQYICLNVNFSACLVLSRLA